MSINQSNVYINRTEKLKPYKWRIKRLKDSKYLLILFLPCFIYLILFRYLPMWGTLIAFKDFSLFKGFFGSPWVGFKNIITFFDNPMALRLILNTFLLSFYSLVWGFPLPILLALLLNEVQNQKIKKFVQTVSYMPHFLSMVVIVGLANMFLSARGFVNFVIQNMGFQTVLFMSTPDYFKTIFVTLYVWERTGWEAIIYIAAISNIDVCLYESAVLDGANKLKRIFYITIPCIIPTVVTMFILNTGNLLTVGFEQVFLMQNPAIISASEVISTYVYKQGITNGDLSYATAIDLFNSCISLTLVIISNYLAKKYSDYNIL